MYQVIQAMTYLGWLSDPNLKFFSDLQIGDEPGALIIILKVGSNYNYTLGIQGSAAAGMHGKGTIWELLSIFLRRTLDS